MDPLIITATPNICWLDPDVPYPLTTGDLVEEAVLCLEAGSTILHTHAEGKWAETLRAVRARCDIVVQCGMSSLPIEERREVFTERADMISVILNHHDEAFARSDCLVLHPREELAEYARLCREHCVVPELEVWHHGSIWNLRWLMERGFVHEPYVTTLFFGWPGGTWSPPTVEEYLYRRRGLPGGCVCTVSVMGEGQREIVAAAVAHGDHVRVGTEDYARDRAGRVAATHELVREAAEVAHALGRPLATVEQARQAVGLRPRR